MTAPVRVVDVDAAGGAPPPRALARDALMAAISPDDDALVRRLPEWSMAGRLDWPWLAERAVAHKVGALAADRLERWAGAAALADFLGPSLIDIRRQAVERAAAARETLRELATALAGGGVPFLLVKGSLLAELVYGDPLLRPFYDVDVIVRRQALPAAEALMRACGYHAEGAWPLLGRRPPAPVVNRHVADDIARRFYLRLFHNLCYHPPRGDPRRPVELHWQIAARGRLRLDEAQLWSRTAAAQVAGIEVRTLDPEATLIHLAVHALDPWFHSFKLLHLCDVAWTVARGTTPYRDLWQLAAAWGAAFHLELALRLVDRSFDLAAARALLADRRASAAMRAALRLAGTRFLIERPAGPTVAWPRRALVELGWGLAVRGMYPKLAFSIGRRFAAARWRLAQLRARG